MNAAKRDLFNADDVTMANGLSGTVNGFSSSTIPTSTSNADGNNHLNSLTREQNLRDFVFARMYQMYDYWKSIHSIDGQHAFACVDSPKAHGSKKWLYVGTTAPSGTAASSPTEPSK